MKLTRRHRNYQGNDENDDQRNLITGSNRIDAALETISKTSIVGIDLESNGFHHYPDRVCLIQIASENQVYLLDMLSVGKPRQLENIFSDSSVEKIFHAADNDIRSIDRDWGFCVNNIFDTSIAAAFLGSNRRGLAAVLKEYLNIEITKEKRLQRADWSNRPLDFDLILYASNDVIYLEQLKELLCEKLFIAGRLDWVREECERLSKVRHIPSDPELAFLSVKGNRKLDGRGLSVLRSLYEFRENEALKRDRPPFKIFSNAVMVELAANPESNLAEAKGMGPYGRPPASVRIRNVIDHAIGMPPLSRSSMRKKTKSPFRVDRQGKVKERMNWLKSWRNEQSKNLNIEAGFLWPLSSLERLAVNPDRLDQEISSEEVRSWQAGEFKTSLNRFLKNIS